MIAFLFLLQLAAGGGGGSPLGPLGKQALPARGCAAFLWSASDRSLVAMASADPARLRLVLDGQQVDLPLTGTAGPGGFGLAGSNRYASGGTQATLDLTVVERADLTAGASIPSATLRVDRTGRDTVVVPVAGLLGCAG